MPMVRFKLKITSLTFLGEFVSRTNWAIIPRFAVWILFMATGVVVIPFGLATIFGVAPVGIAIIIAWFEWAGGINTWMLGKTDFFGEPHTRVASSSGHPDYSEGQ
jgi:hypothetical protein